MAIGTEAVALIVKLRDGLVNVHRLSLDQGNEVLAALGLLISNAEPQRISRLLSRQMKTLLDPMNHSLRGLNLLDVFFKPRKPRVGATA